MSFVDLPKFPLFRGSTLEICEPPLDFFIEKIKNKEVFSLVRQQSEWWHLVYEGLKPLEFGTDIKKYNFQDCSFLDVLASSMRKNYAKIGGSRGWIPHSFTVWRGCLSMIMSKKPGNFFFSVSQNNAWNTDILSVHKTALEKSYQHLTPKRPCGFEVETLIKKMFPDDELLFRSTVWRKWGASSEIHGFFEEFKNERIIIVGRDVYANFGEKLKLSNFSHINVHHHRASEDFEKIKNSIVEQHRKYLKKDEERCIIYLMLGGDTTRYIQWDLHNKLKGNVFMIDVGRGLDPYYREDKIFINNSPLWGHWHNTYRSWIKERCPYAIR